MEVRGFPALLVLELEGTTDVVVITQYRDFRGSWENLFRVAGDGRVVWAAPGTMDPYATAVLKGDVVVARTHFGRLRRLLATTGEIIDEPPHA